MTNQELKIQRKMARGDDNYKTFSVRLPKELVNEIEKLTKESNYSRNELMTILLNYAVKHCSITDD